MPGVKGIDLEQALNYIELDRVGQDFIYNHYTGARLPYVHGARPEIEETARRLTAGAPTPRDQVLAIAQFVAEKVAWAGYHQKRTGQRLPSDRDLIEEHLIRSGYAWCNEQARVFCVLTQAVGLCSRLVFACNKEKKYGHVISEVLLPDGWLTVDQSFPVLFEAGGRPVRACDIWHSPAMRARFQPIYKTACLKLQADLGPGILKASFAMAMAADPLDGLKDLGYHNHFLR